MITYPTQSSYLFAGAYATVRMLSLLSENQLERLLSARDTTEVLHALQDTFLAPHLSVENSSIHSALESAVTAVKKEILDTSPAPHLLTPLWIKYDFYNVRNIIKGRMKGMSREDILATCFSSGTIDPEKLYDAIEASTLEYLNPYLGAVVRLSQNETMSYKIDTIKNRQYFKSIESFSKTNNNAFIAEYLTLLIDIYNFKIKIRLSHIPDIKFKDLFARGGTLSYSFLSENDIDIVAERLGGSSYWLEALDDYKNNNSFGVIDKKAEEYIHAKLKIASSDLWSIAPQYAYFNAVKNNVQTIRAIIAAKDAGISEAELRKTLRRLYR